jgi:hypothetical protein
VQFNGNGNFRGLLPRETQAGQMYICANSSRGFKAAFDEVVQAVSMEA